MYINVFIHLKNNVQYTIIFCHFHCYSERHTILLYLKT